MKKNRTKIIVILILIVGAVWALYPTFKDQQYNSDIDAHSKDSSWVVNYKKQHEDDIKSAHAKAIKLGLDLRGGIDVTMEVDVLKFIEEQANQKDDLFQQVLNATEAEEAKTEEPIVPLFVQKFKEIAEPKGKALANYFYFSNVTSGDDKDIQAQLQKGADEAVDRATEIIRNRIDQFGLTEPNIQKQGSRRIAIELPGVGDPAQVHQLLEGTAQLEFRLIKNPDIVRRILDRIDKTLAADSNGVKSAVAAMTDTSKASAALAAKTDSAKKGEKKNTAAIADTAKKDSAAMAAAAAATPKLSPADSARRADSLAYAGLTPEQQQAKFKREHPFQALLHQDPRSGVVLESEQDRDAILKILARPDIKPLYAGEMSFNFSRPQNENVQPYYLLYFLNATPELTGKVITDALANVDPQSGQPEVTMQMDDEGAKVWKRVTTANIKKQVAIVLDNVVYSAPTVQNPIPNGNSQITGIKDLAEANLLKIVLKAGALPAPVKIIQEQVVGPSLGADSISKGTWSVIWGFIVVIIFMAVYYMTGGFVADLAVLINLLFTLAVLATMGATLTLPGMAGIVLTVGIAVDANVLIYERIREELASGKSLKLAIDDGYKRAFAPIFDGHLTALFSGVILLSFGTGTVQGFGVTLVIGILASFFTAIFITRMVFDILLDKNPEIIKFG